MFVIIYNYLYHELRKKETNDAIFFHIPKCEEKAGRRDPGGEEKKNVMGVGKTLARLMLQKT